MTDEPLIGARYLIPYVRLFPIWRYGPTYDDPISAYQTGEGWRPDWYGKREITREQAEALVSRPPSE